MHDHGVVFARYGQRSLGLEIEVVLSAALEDSLENVRRARQGRGRIAAADHARRPDPRFLRSSFIDREDWLQFLDVDLHERLGLPREFSRRCCDDDDRVTAALEALAPRRFFPGKGNVNLRRPRLD